MSMAVTLMERAKGFLAKKSTQTAAVAILPLAVAAGSAAAEPFEPILLIANGASGGVLANLCNYGTAYRNSSNSVAVNFWCLSNGQVSLDKLSENLDFVQTETGGAGYYTATFDITWRGQIANEITKTDTLALNYSVDAKVQKHAGITTVADGKVTWNLTFNVSPSLYAPDGVETLSQSADSPDGSSGQLKFDPLFRDPGNPKYDWEDPNDRTDRASWEAYLSIEWTSSLLEERDDTLLTNYTIDINIPGSAENQSNSPNYVELGKTSGQGGEAVPLPGVAGGFFVLLGLVGGMRPRRERLGR